MPEIPTEPGKGRPPPQEKAEVLPKLTTEQVFKSQAPIISPDLLKPDDKTPMNEKVLIHPYGEYTIMLEKGKYKIQVLDKNGKKIEDFKNDSTLIFDWAELRGTNKYLANIFTADGALGVKSLPNNLRDFAIKFIAENPNGPVFYGQKSRDISHQNEWEIDVGNTDIRSEKDSITLVNRTRDSFIVFQTVNEKGLPLPTRNWKRFTNFDTLTNELPENLKSEISKSKYELDNGYFANSDDDAFFIFKFGQKIENKFKDSLFADKLLGKKTLCLDPQNNKVIYYCKTNNPEALFKLNTADNDSSLWKTETADFPKSYGKIENLQLDPSGNFFMLNAGSDFIILARDTLQEMGKIPNFSNVKVDDKGRLRGVDEKGFLVYYQPNLTEFETEAKKRQAARVASGIRIEDLFKPEQGASKTPVNIAVKNMDHLNPIIDKVKIQFNQELSLISSFGDIGKATNALGKLITEFKTKGLKQEEIEFIISDLEKSILLKQKELALPLVTQGLTDLGGKLSGNLTVNLLSEAKADLAQLKSLEGFVDVQAREKIITLEKQLGVQTSEFFRREGPVIEGYGRGIVEREMSRLGQMTSKFDFEDWQEHTLPGQLDRLGKLINDYPPDAPPETLEKLMVFAKQLRDMDREYGIKFKEQYAEVRQKGSKIMGERIGLMKVDVDSFAGRFMGRGFKDRSQAEAYVNSSETLRMLRSEIAELAGKNPEEAEKLDKTLKVQIANIMFEIERGGSATIAETGQQMELFGKTLFPRWEGKVHEKTARQVDIIFIPDEKSKGPGVMADRVMGDVGIIEINSRGKVEKRKLYEGLQNEDAWKYGGVSYMGQDVFPSYVASADFRQIKKDYAEWNGGKLKQQFSEKKKALMDLHATRQKFKQRTPEIDNPWKEKYRGLLDEYAKFAQEHHVLLFNRIDQVKNAPETAFANGKGAVEEWQNYWVRDPATEEYLEEMAQISKMQLAQQSGILTIRGNPGAGKDVLVSMFSNRTNRPYFATDCSKWDTAYELSEDIVLESVGGASQTVHVPSTVLNGITTPGAIVYFNEIHALTEPTQIFLHALTDAKRRITLKTSSGKVIKALDSVVLMASMNPQAKDPIEPALRDRMVFMDVDYPPLYGKKDPADPNPNLPIDASEALRIAREVKSLSDLTIEQNIDRNEFVRMWNKYVNGIDNGAVSPSKVQEFDINVILATVQFANKLRENFVAFKSGRSQIASKALPVSLPATGRPLRDCAYALSSISDEQKIAGNPEATARTLLERWFLSKMDNIEDREKIKTAMATWTSSKRPAAN